MKTPTVDAKTQATAVPRLTSKRSRNWIRALLIIVSVVLLLAMLLPLTLFLLFTSSLPLALPQTNVTQEERDDLTRRWLEFQDAIKTDEQAAPFKFSSRDLNIFFEMMPRLRSCVYGTFEENRLQVQYCRPLWVGPKARYVKGTATIIPSFSNKELAIRVVAGRVNGHALPGWLCSQLGRKSLNPEAFGILERFDVPRYLRSLEVRDGCLVLTPQHSEPAHEQSQSPVR